MNRNFNDWLRLALISRQKQPALPALNTHRIDTYL